MKRCGTCKHWFPDPWDASSADRAKFGLCGVVVEEYGLPKRDPLLAFLGSDGTAHLMTLAEFGCVLHEEETT